MNPTQIRPELLKVRGRTADEYSVHVVTKVNGELFRLASYPGTSAPRAWERMRSETTCYCWLVRGVEAAFLPLLIPGVDFLQLERR